MLILLMHDLRLLRRMVERCRRRLVVRSAGWGSLDGGMLLLLRVAPSELVAALVLGRVWVLLGMDLSLGLAGVALLVWLGAVLFGFLAHGGYHCSRDAELVAVAVEDHGCA